MLICGSSPLARGLLGGMLSRFSYHRIIPARAGFTWFVQNGQGALTDHPRSRGVYFLWRRTAASLVGSSPLARGLHLYVPEGQTCLGIIPARAGFTRRGCSATPASGDHPRSRGVYN